MLVVKENAITTENKWNMQFLPTLILTQAIISLLALPDVVLHASSHTTAALLHFHLN